MHSALRIYLCRIHLLTRQRFTLSRIIWRSGFAALMLLVLLLLLLGLNSLPKNLFLEIAFIIDRMYETCHICRLILMLCHDRGAVVEIRSSANGRLIASWHESCAHFLLIPAILKLALLDWERYFSYDWVFLVTGGRGLRSAFWLHHGTICASAVCNLLSSTAPQLKRFTLWLAAIA